MRPILVRVLFCLGTAASLASSYEEAPCKSDDDTDVAACSDRCDEIVAGLRLPLPAPAPTVGTCTTVDEVLGCTCRVGDADTEGETFFVNGEFCADTDRLGDCLVPPDSFPGCSLEDSGSCDDVCALLDRQRARDAAALDATMVEAGCDWTCACSVKVDDRCATFVLSDERGNIDAARVSPASCSLL